MFREVKEFFSIFFNVAGILAKLMFFAFLFFVPGLIMLALNHLFGMAVGTAIVLALCNIITITGLYWIYKIWTNPNLTKAQKWERCFGKNYT